MSITSFPGFDGSITDNDIANYNITSPIYRNRRIGDFLKELHLIEGRNTGYPTVLKSLKENGSESPIIKMDKNRSYITVTIPIHTYFKQENKTNTKEIEFKNKIKSILKENDLSMTEISIKMGYKSISKKLSNTLNLMVNSGEIKKVVIDNIIKYTII